MTLTKEERICICTALLIASVQVQQDQKTVGAMLYDAKAKGDDRTEFDCHKNLGELSKMQREFETLYAKITVEAKSGDTVSG